MSSLTVIWTVATDFVPESLRHELEELHLRLRDTVPFKTLIFDNYSRSEAVLVAAMAEMVVNGVFTCKVSRVIESLC